MATEVNDQYEALGIFPDTWACVAVMSEKDARDYVWSLSRYGMDTRVALDPDGERWHVAVQGGLRASPAAWFATFRDAPKDSIPVCVEAHGQHPMVDRP